MPLKIYGDKSRNCHIIGVAAGKGGVGKSTLTALLALALKELNYRVGVLDADLYGPSQRKMLREDRLPIKQGQRLLPASANGIKLMSMAFFRDEGQASVVRAPIANGLINQFLRDVDWGDLDVLLIDFPPGTGDIQITLAQQGHLSGALVVTTPQEIALLDVRKCVQMFEQLKIPLIGVIENMSYYQATKEGEKVFLFGKGGGEKLARECGAPLIGSIPIDPLIGLSLDRGESIFAIKDPGAEALQALTLSLARAVLNELSSIVKDEKEALGPFELIWKQMQ